MLEIRELSVSIDGKKIIKELSLSIEKGELHVLLGPNGSGKTSLLLALIGDPRYEVEGEIIFKGRKISGLPINERIKLGLGIAFQNPPKVRGVTLGELLSICMGKKKGKGISPSAVRLAESLRMQNFLDRDINVGFSGGEMKRSEILQLLSQNPEFVLLDEPDSGVDVENIGLIARAIEELLERGKILSARRKSGLLITHLGSILDHLRADRAHVLLDGRIACSGDPKEILHHVVKEGYAGCARLCRT
jgi:Fe-S cluster assembly ATP-binding protein